MQIEIKGRNVPVTDDLRRHVERRLEKVSRQVSEFARLEIEILQGAQPAGRRPPGGRGDALPEGGHAARTRRLAAHAALAEPRGRRAGPPGQAPPRQAPPPTRGTGGARRAERAWVDRRTYAALARAPEEKSRPPTPESHAPQPYRRGGPPHRIASTGHTPRRYPGGVSILDRALNIGEAKKFKRYEQRVALISAFEPELELDTDAELRERMDELRERAADGRVARRPAARVLRDRARDRQAHMGMRHFDVQLIGAMVLHEGCIAEMKTGEGKTLTATLAVVLNSLAVRARCATRVARRAGEDRIRRRASNARASTWSPSTTTWPAATPSG